jgi:hypothetical protein
MPVDPKQTLIDPTNKRVFGAVVKARHILLKDLWKTLKSDTEQSNVDQSLGQLQEAGLIQVEPGSLRDFNTYYVTAEGLQMDRKLRRFASAV